MKIGGRAIDLTQALRSSVVPSDLCRHIPTVTFQMGVAVWANLKAHCGNPFAALAFGGRHRGGSG